MFAFRLRSCWLFTLTLKRRRTSKAAGPQSSSMKPVAGRLNAPSVLVNGWPRVRVVYSGIRRQFHRAFAALPPGPGIGPEDMIIIPFIIGGGRHHPPPRAASPRVRRTRSTGCGRAGHVEVDVCADRERVLRRASVAQHLDDVAERRIGAETVDRRGEGFAAPQVGAAGVVVAGGAAG